MLEGIILTCVVLIVGLSVGLLVMGPTTNNAEDIFAVATLLRITFLTLTLFSSTPPKSTVDELKDLQKYCIAIGVATMTPEVTVSKFSLLPPIKVPVLGEDYSIATGVVVFTPEFKGDINDKQD